MRITSLLCLLMAFCINSSAQSTLPLNQNKKTVENPSRCATTERVEVILRNNANARAIAASTPILPVLRNMPTNYRTNAIVTIPVVIHIVLTNPELVTDADVASQIARLNLDYSGMNPDSTNAPNFYAVRGHSQIRFTLARRTPAGMLTTGIERRASSTGSNVHLETDLIKVTASGGLDAWDASSYLNIWVGNDITGEDIHGYTQMPGIGSASQDGVFLSYQCFGEAACSNISTYNKGRTGSHEVGHYFGLFHIWGNENACTSDDFKNLNTVGSTCVLPAQLANAAGQGNTSADIGDTPNQGGPSNYCLVGTVLDACAPSITGKMYQNFMDYTPDACASMFTAKQVARMEYVIDNCRAGLKSSLGASIPISAVTRDAAPVTSVNPGGTDQSGCVSTMYPATIPCSGAFIPKVRIVNNGIDVLSSLAVGVIVNNGPPTTVAISPNLPFGATTIVSFPAINVTSGTYNFKYFTTDANGQGTDQAAANDTLTATLTVTAPAILPVSQTFETGTFPLPWTLYNPDSDATWSATTPGSSSTKSTFIYNYINSSIGSIDELRSPNLAVGTADSVIITFDVAYKNYPGKSNELRVLISKDCGATFTTTLYSKAGAILATAGSSTANYRTPVATDWRRERVAIGGSFLSSGSIVVAIRNTNDNGNNILIDNININTFNIGRYSFIGAGNWSNAANWENNIVPPPTLLAGHE